LYRIAELCEKFREKIYPARDTGRRRPIPGLSRGIRDGWQPYVQQLKNVKKVTFLDFEKKNTKTVKNVKTQKACVFW